MLLFKAVGILLPMRRTALILLFFLHCDLSYCQFLRQPCYSNADCSPPNSVCLKAQGASKGMCLCPPGYAPVGNTNCTLIPSVIAQSPAVRLNHSWKAAAFPAVVNSAVLGKTCSINSDCSSGDPNAICRRVPLFCKKPTSFCICQNGYIVDQGRCKKTASFGELCDNVTACTDPRTVCNPETQTCECDSVSKTHPDIETRCVSATAFSDFDAECYDNSDCYDGLECFHEKCACRIGYRYDDTEKKCIANDIGDECEENDDCFAIKFSYCSGGMGQCDCLPKYNRSVINLKGSPKTVCLPVSKTTRQLGESCEDDENNSLMRNFCRPPFVCLSCTPDGSSKVCTMPVVAVDSSVITTKSPSAITELTSPNNNNKKRILDQPCKLNVDCVGTANAICDARTNACRCKNGFVREDDYTCSFPTTTIKTTKSVGVETTSAAVKVTTTEPDVFVLIKPEAEKLPTETVTDILGKDCEMDEDCAPVEHAICDPYEEAPTCICDEGFLAIGTNVCRSEELIVATTTLTAQKLVSNATKVVATTTLGHHQSLLIGDTCEDDTDCAPIQNAICDDANECQCDVGYVSDGIDKCLSPLTTSSYKPSCQDKLCEFAAKCRQGVDSCKTQGAVCYNGFCQCPIGTKYGLKDDCIDVRRKSYLNEVCDDSRDCMYGLICDSYKCRCYPGYKTIGNYDCDKRIIGDACSFDNDCRYVKYGVCIRRKCACDLNYHAVSPDECVISVWLEAVAGSETAVPCVYDSDCVGPGVPLQSICGPRGFCQCPSNAYLDDDQRCKYKFPTDFSGWACAYNRDCGKGYVCQNDECQKQGAVVIMSTATKSTTQLNTIVLSTFLLLAALIFLA